MNVTLSNSKKIKNYLILSFNGICGVGSVGNIDADYIIECLKEELKNDKNLQGVILDFSGMQYKFGNRIAKILDSNILKPNSILYIRIIPKEGDFENWKTLIDDCTTKSYHDFLADTIEGAVMSINKEMNN